MGAEAECRAQESPQLEEHLQASYANAVANALGIVRTCVDELKAERASLAAGAD